MDKVQVKQFKNDLNEKQLKAFYELKEQVLEESKMILKDANKEQLERYQEDNQMVRLLYAREFKVKKSLEMWKKWVQWRLEFKADSITESEIVEELKSGKCFWHGQDKLGNPSLVVKVKYHRPGVSSPDTMLRFFLYTLEQGIKKCEAAGTGKISVVWDREGFERKNFDGAMFETFKRLNVIMQDNYAERLQTIYILNPNWFFKAMFAIVKPFLTARTKSKITIIEKNKDLLKFFEPDQLLTEHGGTSQFVYTYPPQSQHQNGESLSSNINEKIQEEKGIDIIQTNHIEERKKQSPKAEEVTKKLIPNQNEDDDFNEANFNEIEEDINNMTISHGNYDIDSLSKIMFQKEFLSKD